MTDYRILIAAARVAVQGTTPGPWDANEAFDASFVCAGDGSVAQTWIVRLDNRPGRVKDRQDARFIATARELVPALADALAEATAELERLRQLHQSIHD